MMDKVALEKLKVKIKPICVRYGLAEVFLFGSRARGENRPDSDYDFYIKPGCEIGMFELSGLFIALKGLLAHEVDIVTGSFDKLDDYMKDAIAKDGILIYKDEKIVKKY